MSDPLPPEIPMVVRAESRTLSISEQAMLDAAKQLQAQAVSVGRDYNQSMLGFTISTIGAYIAIITLLSKENKSSTGAFVMLIPVFIQLIAAAIFAVGFHSRLKSWSLELQADVQHTIQSLILWRYRTGLYGTITLLLSIAIAAIIILAQL